MTYLSQLHKQLIKRCSLEDVRNLCFLLDLNHEDFPDAGRTALGRTLITHIAQNNRLPDLLHALHEEKPNHDWLPIPPDFNYQQDPFITTHPKPTTTLTGNNNTVITGNQNTVIGPRGVNITGSTIKGNIITGNVTNPRHNNTPTPPENDPTTD
ncbi:MAG TPA: hypothetical protein VLL52_18490 [Anaerolineae bacterium]|nr:hypothetical protein [Anaerolineae bacterium]